METADLIFLLVILASLFLGVGGFMNHGLGWETRMSVTAMVIGFSVCVASVVWWVSFDRDRWKAYAAQHHCAATGQTKTVQIQSCNMVGKIMVCTPRLVTRHAYACDDNERLWR